MSATLDALVRLLTLGQQRKLTWKLLLTLYLGKKLLDTVKAKIWLSKQGKAVYITGCDSGFGRSTALRLSKAKVTVFAGCLTAKGVNELLECKAHAAYLRPLQVDVTDQDSVTRAAVGIELMCAELGLQLWGILNNAGVLRGGPIDTCPISDWNLQYNVNVLGMVRTTISLLPLLRASQGRIINVASVAGFVATQDTASYNASKFAVEGLTDSLRIELRKWGITVITIEPGIMKTPLWDTPLNFDQIMSQQYDKITPDLQNTYGERYFVAKHAASKKLVDWIGGDPNRVVQAMCNGLMSRYPQSRYTVGLDTPGWRLLTYLPDWLSDFLLDKLQDLLMGGVYPAALTKTQ